MAMRPATPQPGGRIARRKRRTFSAANDDLGLYVKELQGSLYVAAACIAGIVALVVWALIQAV
jgi:hypothetical protein